MERATKRLAKEKLVALKAAEADPKGRGSLDDVDESSSLDDADPLRFIGLDYADENASVQSSSASEAEDMPLLPTKKRKQAAKRKGEIGPIYCCLSLYLNTIGHKHDFNFYI